MDLCIPILFSVVYCDNVIICFDALIILYLANVNHFKMASF